MTKTWEKLLWLLFLIIHWIESPKDMKQLLESTKLFSPNFFWLMGRAAWHLRSMHKWWIISSEFLKKTKNPNPRLHSFMGLPFTKLVVIPETTRLIIVNSNSLCIEVNCLENVQLCAKCEYPWITGIISMARLFQEHLDDAFLGINLGKCTIKKCVIFNGFGSPVTNPLYKC